MILTKGSDAALEVSAEARYHLKQASKVVGDFAGRYEDSVGLKADIGASSDPRTVAAAVNAQIQSLAPALTHSGQQCHIIAHTSASFFACRAKLIRSFLSQLVCPRFCPFD